MIIADDGSLEELLLCPKTSSKDRNDTSPEFQQSKWQPDVSVTKQMWNPVKPFGSKHPYMRVLLKHEKRSNTSMSWRRPAVTSCYSVAWMCNSIWHHCMMSPILIRQVQFSCLQTSADCHSTSHTALVYSAVLVCVCVSQGPVRSLDRCSVTGVYASNAWAGGR